MVKILNTERYILIENLENCGTYLQLNYILNGIADCPQWVTKIQIYVLDFYVQAEGYYSNVLSNEN